MSLLEQQLEDRATSRAELPQLQEEYQANMTAWDSKQHAIANLLRCTMCCHITYLPIPMCPSGHISCIICLRKHIQDVGPTTDATIVTCIVCVSESPISELKERPCLLYQLNCMPTDSKCEYCSTKIFGVRMPFHILCCPQRPVQCNRCVPSSTFPASEWKVHQDMHDVAPGCMCNITSMIAGLSTLVDNVPSDINALRNIIRMNCLLQDAMR